VIDTVLRLLAILVMFGVIFSAGQMIWWLGSAWLPSSSIPLSVQAFEVSRGEKPAKEEGKYLAARFVAKINEIQTIMSADLSDLNEPNQVRVESALPKSLRLQPDVPTRIDVTVKAFDVDVVGILETVYKFFDRSDRMSVSITAGEKMKVFASFKPENPKRSIGPWWLVGEKDEQTTIDNLAYQFSLDLYRTEVKGLDGCDAKSFARLVAALADYQKYVRARHASASAVSPQLLDAIKTSLVEISQQAKTCALVYSYLGSTLSLQDDTTAAIVAYTKAKELDSTDNFAATEIARLTTAKALQPSIVKTASASSALDSIRGQRLVGYAASDKPATPPPITVAVLATGISKALKTELGKRMVGSISVIANETSDEDDNGHGTSVASLVAALAPEANILSIKCISSSGAGSESDIIEAMRRAVERKADIILLPLGGVANSRAQENAVAAALKAGKLIVASAGNSGGDKPGYPAAFEGVLPIGALDQPGNGPAPFTNRGTKTLYAPGVDIRVLNLEGLADQSGTSFSAAIAASAAAVVWGAKRDFSAIELRTLLETSSVRLPVASDKSGAAEIRRIDMLAALR
jgi:hypothetical protein